MLPSTTNRSISQLSPFKVVNATIQLSLFLLFYENHAHPPDFTLICIHFYVFTFFLLRPFVSQLDVFNDLFLGYFLLKGESFPYLS